MSAASNLSIWHPFTQAHADPVALPISRAEGAYLYTTDGRRIIDAISSWWVNLHGHCHPQIAKAIAAQVEKLDHVLLAGFSHEPIERLTGKLRRFVPSALTNIFFSDDGSTAVEVALKLAVQYWSNQGCPEKQEIIALDHAYHGDTAGAMSVSADSGFTTPFSHLRFPVHRVHSAYCARCPVGRRRTECSIDCLESLRTTLKQRSDRIAAMIVEPLLQGAGGMIVHPVEFLKEVRRLCDRYGVLLIADEVLTGFGRCGKMFACEIAGVVPDLMCISKGITGGFLPLGATLCTKKVYREFCGAGLSFFHGHSYTGNPLACAAAVANLEIFERGNVWEQIGAIAELHKQRLKYFSSHPDVLEVRQIGTIAVIELKAEDAGYFSTVKPHLYKFFLERGVLLRPLGHIIYVLPPYCIRSDDLNLVYDVIQEAVSLVRHCTTSRSHCVT